MRVTAFLFILLVPSSLYAQLTLDNYYPDELSEGATLTISWSSSEVGTWQVTIEGEVVKEGKIDSGQINITQETRISNIDEMFGDGELEVTLTLYPEDCADCPALDSFSFTVKLDTTPEIVEGLGALGGNGVIIVSWNEHPDFDIEGYVILWGSQFDCPGGCADDPDNPKEDEYPVMTTINDRKITSYTLSEGIQNGVEYYVSILAYDEGKKKSKLAPEVSAIPQDIGAFSDAATESVTCVIAKLINRHEADALRKLRDKLMESRLGRAVVSAYYKVSDRVSQFFGKGGAQDRILRFILKAIVKILDWFSSDSEAAIFSVQIKGTGFKLTKIKPWYVWESIYKGSLPFITASLGWKPLRKFGVLEVSLDGGLAFGRAYGKVVTKPILTYTEEEIRELPRESRKNLTFLLFPISANLKYRLEFLEEQLVSPFGLLGIDVWFFRESHRVEGEFAKGRVIGWHFGGGLAILLDRIDREGAGSAKVNWGIENSWIFFEFRRNFINLKGNVFKPRKVKNWDFSGDLFLGGIAFDLSR